MSPLPWHASVLTLFPEMFPGPLGLSLAGRALQRGLWRLDAVNIRDYTDDRHQTVDDTPFGGGAGMVMRPDIVARALDATASEGDARPCLFLTPRGRPLSQARVMPAKTVCKLPDAISFETGAAMMLKGLTAQYLLKKTLPVEGLQPGDFVLFHAAAGGVGLIACQWAKALGLQLIGTAGSDAKCQLALANGAAHAINYSREDFAARVKEITGGKGVKVVYDSVGKDTWDKSLDCLRPFGLMASFGNASGPVPAFAPGQLGPKGSLYLTRQTLFTHISTRESTQAMADDLFAVVASGQVKIHIDQRYPLADVQQAHRDLEARKTTGCTILTL